ncbi:MAG TPA: hypothetical protein V6C98_16155, partial [Thermosynechococcaceae cyanobacterium]
MTAINASTGSAGSKPDVPTSIRSVIQDAHNRGATALYLQPGRPPFYRMSGKLLPQDHLAPLAPEQFRHYLQEVLTPQQLKHYLEVRKLDMDVRIPGFMQGRINCGPTAQGTEAMSINAIALDGPDQTVQRQGTVQVMVEDAYKQRASDIHLQVGEPVRFRIQGKMVKQETYGKVTSRQFEEFLQEVLLPAQQELFKARQELDTAVLYDGMVRCRVNCSQSIMGGAMVLRLISLDVPTLRKLGLPDILREL